MRHSNHFASRSPLRLLPGSELDQHTLTQRMSNVADAGRGDLCVVVSPSNLSQTNALTASMLLTNDQTTGKNSWSQLRRTYVCGLLDLIAWLW